jgi:hypothetical protein
MPDLNDDRVFYETIVDDSKKQTYDEFLRDESTCNYCGNRFDDKRCSHSVCGMA